jgi:hypothetical protein
MPIRRVLRWTIPTVALVALVASLTSGNTTPIAPAEAAPQLTGMVPVAGPAAPVPPAAGPGSLAAVQKFVDQKNSESEAAKFEKAGWRLDHAPPPDPKLLALDPSLLEAREAELRQQIATTTASGGQAKNLAAIARDAHEEATQVAAVEALGRIRSDEAQQELTDLLHALPDGTLARREVAPLLKPQDLADARAAKMAALLDDGDLNAVERKQIAFTLSLVGLRDRSQLPADVLAQLSPAARELLAQATSLARLERRTP